MKNESTGCSTAKLQKQVHDLRNRLNNIAMNAELARLEMGSLDPMNPSTFSSSGAEVLSCLSNILAACKESADTVDAIAESAQSGAS